MVVIKIGGSLQSSAYIKRWIKTIELEFDNSFLLIFGGGKYADQVRKEQKIKHYDDYQAHILAINAMKYLTNDHLCYLRNFKQLHSIEDIKKNYKKRKLLVWIPSFKEVLKLNISSNWDSTSDSIALSIANKINAPLLLVKSIKFNKKKFLNNFFLKQDVIDKDFCRNYPSSKQKISIVFRGNSYKLKKICKDFALNSNC
tara:strand:+ start:778 stop:1377 length:600 start_codon:yes stop_codon:yes gene_type:complete